MCTFKLVFLGFLVVFTTTSGYSQTPPLSYSTNFSVTEDPLSEGGRWINGKTTGLIWADVRVTSGLAHGTQSGVIPFDDSTAVLAGNWGPNQMVQATVHTVNQDSSFFEEVELRLRTTITANSLTGYEINFRCTADGTQYIQIVRWNGSLGSFTYVDTVGGPAPGLRNGDVVKATIVGSTITVFLNGTQVMQGTDSTFTSGNPGIGFYLENASGVNADFGFTNFTASEIGTTESGPSVQPNSTILRGDFNGDGKNDILWQHTDGSTSMWLMDGLSVINSGGLLGPGTGWSAQQVGDFNGDGKSDILWANSDGSTFIWLMNGLSVLSSGSLLGPGTGWSVKNVGDFNGDGKTDIVWQNVDGSAAIWLMNGLTAQSGAGLIGPATGWSAQFVGDFNGDGISDIVWQNVDGSTAIWLMNGLSVSSGSGLLGAGTGWSVIQIGDFDGDGKSDIAWQHVDGSVAVWLMNGLSVNSGTGLLGAGTGWSVNRIGDLNGDGKSDIVWQHTDGSSAVWLMNGLGVISGSGLVGAGTGWSVNRVGDFNNDSNSDIVWHHTDGSVAIWLMNGLSASADGSLIGPGTGWSPAP